MRETIVFIGGDARTAAAAEKLANEGFSVSLVGFEKYKFEELPTEKAERPSDRRLPKSRAEAQSSGASSELLQGVASCGERRKPRCSGTVPSQKRKKTVDKKTERPQNARTSADRRQEDAKPRFGQERNTPNRERSIRFSEIGEGALTADCFVLPTPCSRDGKTVFAPFSETEISIPAVRKMLFGERTDETERCEKISEKGEEPSGKAVPPLVVGGVTAKFFPEASDLTEREDFKLLNAVPSAEGAVATALSETDITLWKANCVVVGFGKIGKRLAALLRAFGAFVTVTARKTTDFAEARAAGFCIFNTREVAAAMPKADIVFNTVPHSVIGEKEISAAKQSTLFEELASAPGGIDKEACLRLGRKYVSALGLPGRFSPRTAGEIMAEAVKNAVSERQKQN